MLMNEPASFIKSYLEEVNQSIRELNSWNTLFIASIKRILKQYRITQGILVLDETDRARSKRTKRLYKTYKQKDKMTGGYVNGQTIVLLLLVSDSVTIPVGFAFYMPDPVLSAWRREEERLKKKGVPKRNRPCEPNRNPNYPTKVELGLELLHHFQETHHEITVKGF